MIWMVGLTGDSNHLSKLSDDLTSDDLKIFQHDDGCYYLSSNKFNKISSSETIREESLALLEHIRGINVLMFNYIPQIEINHICCLHNSGKKDLFVYVKTAVAFASMLKPEIRVTNKKGEIINQKIDDKFIDLVKLASQNPHVGKVLRLLCICKNKPNWVELYRIYEVIESSVNDKTLYLWVEKSKIKIFKHTANSVSVTGDLARHGKEKNQPPPVPMLLSDARILIKKIINQWIGWFLKV